MNMCTSFSAPKPFWFKLIKPLVTRPNQRLKSNMVSPLANRLTSQMIAEQTGDPRGNNDETPIPGAIRIREDWELIEDPLNWPKRIKQWIRLCNLYTFMMEHCRLGAVLHGVRAMWDRMKADALKKAIDMSTPEEVTRLSAEAKGKPATARASTCKPWKYGPKLPTLGKPPGNQLTWPKEESQCDHSNMSAPRGGQGNRYWITCLGCGTRWERIPLQPGDDTSQSSSTGTTGIPQPQPTTQTRSTLAAANPQAVTVTTTLMSESSNRLPSSSGLMWEVVERPPDVVTQNAKLIEGKKTYDMYRTTCQPNRSFKMMLDQAWDLDTIRFYRVLVSYILCSTPQDADDMTLATWMDMIEQRETIIQRDVQMQVG